MGRRFGRVTLLTPFAALTVLVVALSATRAMESPFAAQPSAARVSGELAALTSGAAEQDSRIARLVPGYRTGELAYFALFDGSLDAGRRDAITHAGARVLRTYRTVDAVAIASTPAAVEQIARLPWVQHLTPIELVFRANHEREVDQTRATTGDVGAQALWDRGVTGRGITVAVLDTGLDPTHPDVDDLDFRHWSSLPNAPKIVEARNFVGGACAPVGGDTDGHGHGTHVAGIAVGTGEGTPLPADNGKYAGVAPDARLAVGKVLTDAGAGLNSDLIAALEWAAMPPAPGRCAVGADIVNLSLGSESRPTRLNTGSDVDLVSLTLNRLAVQYGTLFTVAAGNSGPFLGSVLESPGSASQALSVAATAKDWDVNHDDTLSGDTCAGWRHPRSTSFGDNDCSAGVGDQPPSISSFSSRGPSGDLWLRPDVAAPGYNIVSAQAATGAALAQNDLNKGTRADPLYATATGTSMAAPATAGAAALLLDAYRQRHGGADPTGASGIAGLEAPAYALLRAALMNTAGSDLFESRWILTTDAAMQPPCPFTDPLFLTFCEIGSAFTQPIQDGFGSFTLYEVRNRALDPYVGPLAEGAGKLRLDRAVPALTDGVVAYSTASGSGADRGTGPRDFQGSWQIGSTVAGATHVQQFVLRAAPGTPSLKVRFAFSAGNPSDGSQPIPTGQAAGAWSIKLPGTTTVPATGSAVVKLTARAAPGATPGHYTGAVIASVSNGQVLRIPVFASVALHDTKSAAGVTGGGQARVDSARDVFGKADTVWPSAAGAAGTGAGSDWLVFPVELASGLREARLSVYDAVPDAETYDLYLYDAAHNLVANTHPFAAPGVTDPVANDARGPSTPASPQRLVVTSPAAGRHYLVVSRAKIGGTGSGDFGAFVLTLDEAS
ncbi:MAG: S8 family serine peptidase [Actinomycetota bacterium]|nr:S8 family serine peptidase [Actinomycetota bacterium]